MKNIFRDIKRVISQAFENLYFYNFKRQTFYWYDTESKKFMPRKEFAGSTLSCTWDGENDILAIMLLKIEHMYHNLKHYGVQADFYLDSYNILKHGTVKDKLWAFNKYMKEADQTIYSKEDEWLQYKHHNTHEDGSIENKFFLGWDFDGNKKYLMHKYEKDGTSCWTLRKEDSEMPFDGVFTEKAYDKDQQTADVIDGIIDQAHSIYVGVKEYRFLSDGLKQFVRGNRRSLTDLLKLRHLVKKLYCLEDTDDKYSEMWIHEKDQDRRSKKLDESRKLYEKDRKELYTKICNLMCERGEGWWD